MSTKWNRDTVLRPTDKQVSTELGDDAVILSFQDGVYYSLNPVGARVWQLLRTSSRSIGELLAVLLDEYDVDEARCEADLIDLVGQLEERKLLEVHDGPA